MKLIVGLGNPGPKYETTRHNAGFLAIDRLVDRWNASGPAIKHQADVFDCTVKGEKALLIKPKTYMNLSGKTVGPLFSFYKCSPSDLVVIHDEVDLMPGVIKVKKGGGTGGHNGLKSVNHAVGNDALDYFRLRIGVGRSNDNLNHLPTEDFVLSPFTDNELKELDTLLDDVAEACELLVQNKSSEAMNRFNQKKKPKEEESKS